MIPKSFMLANRTWKVRLLNEAQWRKLITGISDDKDLPERLDALGHCDPGPALILVNVEAHEGSQDYLEHTFFHELAHAIQYAEGHVNHDESYTDRLGGYLHQIFKTQKGQH